MRSWPTRGIEQDSKLNPELPDNYSCVAGFPRTSAQQISSAELEEKVVLSRNIKDIDHVLEKLFFKPGAMNIRLAQQLQDVALL
jgi:hypothetical protein